MRIGLDQMTEQESYAFTQRFVEVVSGNGSGSGVNHFIVHARKAILDSKFTPADNRRIPPLRHGVVHQLCRDFPFLAFTINGGITTLEEAQRQLALSDDMHAQAAFISRDTNIAPHTTDGISPLAGVMVGRACVDNPFQWSVVDSQLCGTANENFTRREILEKYAEYARRTEQKEGPRCRRSVTKPILRLFAGEANGRLFRSRLDTLILQGRDKHDGSGKEVMIPIDLVILQAAEAVGSDVLDITPEEWHHSQQLQHHNQQQQRQQ